MPKKRKKKLAFPRRQWQINPATRVKASAKNFPGRGPKTSSAT